MDDSSHHLTWPTSSGIFRTKPDWTIPPNANSYDPHVRIYDNRMARAICTPESPLLTVTVEELIFVNKKELFPHVTEMNR